MPVSIRKLATGGRVEMRILSDTARQTGVMQLTPREARRVAAALLLQSSPEQPDLEHRIGDERAAGRASGGRRRVRLEAAPSSPGFFRTTR